MVLRLFHCDDYSLYHRFNRTTQLRRATSPQSKASLTFLPYPVLSFLSFRLYSRKQIYLEFALQQLLPDPPASSLAPRLTLDSVEPSRRVWGLAFWVLFFYLTHSFFFPLIYLPCLLSLSFFLIKVKLFITL